MLLPFGKAVFANLMVDDQRAVFLQDYRIGPSLIDHSVWLKFIRNNVWNAFSLNILAFMLRRFPLLFSINCIDLLCS